MSLNTLESLAPKDEHGVQQDNETLQTIESVCITWFTIEYILRLAGKAFNPTPHTELLIWERL